MRLRLIDTYALLRWLIIIILRGFAVEFIFYIYQCIKVKIFRANYISLKRLVTPFS